MNSNLKPNRNSKIENRGDTIFSYLLNGAGAFILILIIALAVTLFVSSIESMKKFGFGFLVGVEWNPVDNVFGVLPFIVGTLITSFLAVAISLPFSIAVSLFLGEYFKNGPISVFLRSVIELMAGIPSVIFGFWGIVFLVPIVRNIEIALGFAPYGVGIFSASLILSIMIIPYSAAIAREIISMVPVPLKEAAYSLGATRFEVIKNIVFPYAGSGITAGVLLSLGRAFGETMAVTMLIGNMNMMPTDIFSPANSMASIIANEFAEASGGIKLSALMEIGLVLFGISFLINFAGRTLVKRMEVKTS